MTAADKPIEIEDPSKISLFQIHGLLFDITLADSFSQLSKTDQDYITKVKDRLRRRLNAVGIKTLEDFADEHFARFNSED